MSSKWSLRPNIEQGRKLLNRFNMLSSKSKAIENYKKEVLEFLQQQLEGSLRAFTFEELSAATQDFDQLLFLGEGGFGKVYKGFLSDPSPAASTTLENGPSRRYQEVAVKRLRVGGLQGHREWLNEVYFLGRFRHPNLVRLIGFCAQLTSLQEERLLVYEFVLHGSLENLLFQSTNFFMPMPWNRRVDVAVDAACGLTFLHDHQVINRDIKPSNILVDHNFVAKLSDFGLARMGPKGDNTHVTTRVLGTWEYAAPEYIRTGHLTLQSDIWSFGIVLLELLSGRRAMDRHRPSEEQNLLVWAKPFLEQKLLSQLIDPQLNNRYSIEEANEVLSLVQQCLTKNPKDRPTMKEIFQRLSLLKDSKLKATDRTPSTTSVVETTETPSSSMSSLLRESASQGGDTATTNSTGVTSASSSISSTAITSLQRGNP
ncbi:unnamed protein product [Sphagnum jensenii]|uniref:Protein kinase domain-containing protein n=1 Tax=Sphagnum jensenii TaxID=128206 RepID=A0ABP1B4Z1_9BRYO